MKVVFKNKSNIELDGQLDLPKDQEIRAYAIFAHCFTCSKSLSAVRNIAKALKDEGIGVLRFDFTGLGQSSGEFADSNFSSNVDDLISAADYLKETRGVGPQLLIGHSLGGAAVLFATTHIEGVKAVATIGAPFGPGHVSHLFERSIPEIEAKGIAEVNIGGRPFTVKKQFLDDISAADPKQVLKSLNAALCILHSPHDRIVEIENATKNYTAARHPKSFISLDGADHLLSDKSDSIYAGKVISSWANRYIDSASEGTKPTKTSNYNSIAPVSVIMRGNTYTADIYTSDHHLIGDEPLSVGGNNLGPTPFDFLLTALGACTAMTLRMYIRRKKWEVTDIQVHLSSERVEDAFQINRALKVQGNIDDAQFKRLNEIADKCPVHKVLHGEITVKDWDMQL
jgi:putative redox protein